MALRAFRWCSKYQIKAALIFYPNSTPTFRLTTTLNGERIISRLISRE
jgi:hypothetical protein